MAVLGNQAREISLMYFVHRISSYKNYPDPIAINLNLKRNDIKKILFIDDDSSLLEIIPLILEDFEVYTHHSAVDLEMRIRELVPDLIILDVNLRDIDGSNACRQLKSNASLKHIPVILITAGLFLQKDRDCDAAALLEKPFDISYLTEIIISLLD